MKVFHPSQLSDLRGLQGAKEIRVEADKFLAGNLPLYLFKYAAWAMAEGGITRVSSSKTVESMGIIPSEWSFQFLVQEACKAIEGLGELTEVDVSCRTFSFTRTAPISVPGLWSAVVLFSGNEKELPLLEACINSLRLQPELTGGGQIVVCGPTYASSLITAYPGVEYLPCETPTRAGRFLVGKKKNFAVSQMRNERVLVCHSRIVLEAGCLSKLPAEFELITPKVLLKATDGRRIPYLDLFFQHLHSSALYTDHLPPPLAYPRADWRRYLRDYYPYVDGGLFCVMKSNYLENPLSETIAWGEGEDLEWCRRMLINGKIIELCIGAIAESQTDKLEKYSKWGHIPGVVFLGRGLRRIRAFAHRQLG